MFESHSDTCGNYLASPPPLLKKGQNYQVFFWLKVDSGTGIFDDVPVDQVNKYIADKMDKDLYSKFFFEKPENDTPLFVSLFGCIPLD
jgi:hypothetical protein